MEAFKLSNVELSKKLIERVGEEKIVGIHPMIENVVYKLAVDNPLWKFVCIDANWRHTVSNHLVDALHVFDSGEKIGEIGHTNRGANRVISIGNDRIDSKRVRASSYCTTDETKAYRCAKKMFYRKKPDERIGNADKNATQMISNQQWRKGREKSTHDEALNTAALKFINTTEGRAYFSTYLDSLHESDKKPLLKARDESTRLHNELITIQAVRKKYEDNQAALIVRDGNQYVVRSLDNVFLYDDTTLPEMMRAKLGMLKLVEAEHFISNIGCRVSEEVFVVLMDEQ